MEPMLASLPPRPRKGYGTPGPGERTAILPLISLRPLSFMTSLNTKYIEGGSADSAEGHYLLQE